MATTGTEKHTRVSIMLLKGGTKITRRLFEKRVVEMTPQDHTSPPWTVDEFLLANKPTILKSKAGKDKENIYFPVVYDKTNLNHWDLNMFCHVLLESADANRTVKMDIHEMRKLRNKLCHLSEPSLDDTKYGNYVDKIEVIFERLLKEVGDERFEQEIKDLLQTSKQGPLSLEYALINMHRFHLMDLETREILSEHTKDHQSMLQKLDTIIEQTKATGEAAIQLPDTDVEIIVKNCSSDKQIRLSQLLKKLIDENINKHAELKDDLSNVSLHQLKEAVDKAVMTFLSNGQQITETQMKCILLRIRCFSLNDLVRLFRDCVSGKLNQQFKPLEAAVKQIPEFKEVTLEAVIFEDEFWKVMEKTVSSIDEYVSALTRRKSTVTLEQKESNNGSFHHTVKVSIPTESAGHLEHLKRSFKSGQIKNITNSIQEAACKELNVTNVSIEARLLEETSNIDARDHQAEKREEPVQQRLRETTHTEKAEVCYPYAAVHSDDLTLNEGDAINVLEKQDDGLLKGELNGNVGSYCATLKEEAGNILVGAIDFGTTYSGWAILFAHEFETEPTKGYVKQWNSGTLKTDKTPTVVLIRPDGKTLEAFGYEAEDRYSELVAEEAHTKYYYFRRFKMSLHKQLERRFDYEMTDEMGHNLRAMTVVSLAIHYLVDDMHAVTKDIILRGIEKSEIHLVITVPAIWTDSAKEFMRKAGEQAGILPGKLTIALEQDAASIFCRYMPIEKRLDTTRGDIASFPAGTRYMVLDAGGCTIDITVNEVQQSGTVNEITAASVYGCGGTLVDTAFQNLMINIVGENVYTSFKHEHTEDWLDLWREFEVKKRKAHPDNDSKVVMRIPLSLNEICEQENRMSLAKIVNSSKYKKVIQFVGDKVKFEASVFKYLFDTSITETIQQTKNLFRDKEVQKVKAILMVGGFSESPILQKAVKSTFPSISIIIPAGASSAVMRGATIFGHNPMLITERVLKHTYGMQSYALFIEGEDPESRRVVTDKGFRCKNVFSKHVEKNQVVEVGKPQSRKAYTPLRRNQCSLKFALYASELLNPRYTDYGCTHVGELSVDLPNHDGGLDRTVWISLTFSGANVVVEAVDERSGKTMRASFDLLC